MDYMIGYDDFKDFMDKNEHLIVIDSSVFLDYYRYSSNTSEEILKTLEAFKNDIWLPFQVYLEFNNNYEHVKKNNHNKYQNVSSSIESYSKGFNEKLNKLFNQYGKYDFPKIHELKEKIKPILEKLKEEVKTYHGEIDEEVKTNKELMKKNAIYEFINTLKSSNKIGASFSGERLLEIIEEGQRRYQFNIPPGYEDREKAYEKNEKPDPKRPYGDLIIWKSILKQAKEQGKPIIFTTSDSKEDWWILDDNKAILGPRHELVSEFEDFVGVKNNLMMLPMREFFKYFSKYYRTSSVYTMIELDAEDISLEYIKDNSLFTITAELIHNGELQEFMDYGVMDDVNDLEIYDDNLEEINIDLEDELAYITGSFTLSATADVSESLSSNYSKKFPYYLVIGVGFSLELKLEIEEESYSVKDFELHEVKVISAERQYTGMDDDDELCDSCGKSQSDITLFPDKTICTTCANSGGYFICTNCSMVYEQEDYHGDGEHCQRCD
ncbi:PIN-like domain-containing protein [Lysinibacillus fusiformis]|uniref:PIN-like domain-containing protein n=1 Tax=Lysinibacillus fusiformis TaxID=28031 RepID=UPI00088E5780|nr:PIN domain-containing protein [Lysinibacillus fusiformis]SCX63311.1 hypothetical protein SAMN02787108_03225 [Lysinibacillus fusiformis]SDB46054.1 hypothetical protein SAMN02787070_03420 [Lysinibacillus fusiformis]SFI72176.1 hypothetical protein SAMN02787080_03439 [Lysinibacillus fusiformis]SFT15329.1 hypothetical protein SAMN02787099_03140 [Lysinibacillus fusiformis]